MKSIQLKSIFILTLSTILLSGCTKDSDAEYPVPPTNLVAEDFDNPGTSPYALTTDLTSKGWTSYAEQGTKLWLEKSYKDDGYAFFTSFGSGQPANTAWLISPGVDMDKQNGEKLFFLTCTDGFVRNIDNSLELLVSTDYDGTNFTAASWRNINFKVADQNTTKFVYVESGIIDLSSYKGTLHFAFKVKGTSALTGGYQIDRVRLFY